MCLWRTILFFRFIICWSLVHAIQKWFSNTWFLIWLLILLTSDFGASINRTGVLVTLCFKGVVGFNGFTFPGKVWEVSAALSTLDHVLYYRSDSVVYWLKLLLLLLSYSSILASLCLCHEIGIVTLRSHVWVMALALDLGVLADA